VFPPSKKAGHMGATDQLFVKNQKSLPAGSRPHMGRSGCVRRTMGGERLRRCGPFADVATALRFIPLLTPSGPVQIRNRAEDGQS
jgi:hypothetical protein